MLKFHLPYHGPPEKCKIRDYRYLFFFVFVMAAFTFWLASSFANSSAAIAGAIHSFVHSVLYAITSFTEWLFENRKYNEAKRQKISLLLGFTVYTPVILLGLGYVVVFEAWPRYLQPDVVDSRFMSWSAIIDLTANLTAWLYLREIRISHETKDTRHSLLIWDAVEDVLLAMAVFGGALLIRATGVYRIDSVLTFIAAGWIIWQVYRILSREIRVRS